MCKYLAAGMDFGRLADRARRASLAQDACFAGTDPNYFGRKTVEKEGMGDSRETYRHPQRIQSRYASLMTRRTMLASPAAALSPRPTKNAISLAAWSLSNSFFRP